MTKNLLTALFLSLALMLTACGKDVSNNGGADLTPGTPPSTVPPVSSPSGYLTMNFANHGEAATNQENPTSFEMSESLTLTLPTSPNNTTFNSNPTHPVLTLLVNNSYACSYVWNGTQYTKHSSCLTTMRVDANSVLTIVGIPQQQIVAMKIYFQK
jgi:hypothetical protein